MRWDTIHSPEKRPVNVGSGVYAATMGSLVHSDEKLAVHTVALIHLFNLGAFLQDPHGESVEV